MKPGQCKEMLLTAKVKAIYYNAMKAKLKETQMKQIERLPSELSNPQTYVSGPKSSKTPYISVETPKKLEDNSENKGKKLGYSLSEIKI